MSAEYAVHRGRRGRASFPASDLLCAVVRRERAARGGLGNKEIEMKVSELIERLKNLPQDVEVVISELDGWTHLHEERAPDPKMDGAKVDL